MMTFETPYEEDDSSSEESVEDDCPCSCYEAVCSVSGEGMVTARLPAKAG